MIRKEAIFRISLGACILLLSGRLISSETPGTYVGWKRCAMCHSDISGDWQNGRHAHAFESLKKTGQENLPACVGCHVTGYEQDGGFIDYDITPEMVSVQCEECHGRGSEHAVNPAGKVLVKAPGVDVCRRCHTEGQDPAFDYNKKVTGVHGPEH